MPGFVDGVVVAGIDGSSSAVQAAVWAGAEAGRRGRPLRLVQVYALPQVKAPVAFGTHEQVRAGLAERAEGRLAEARDAVLAEYPGLDVTTAAREWSPVTALVQESQHAELLVLGSHGLGGFTGLLVGSTVAAVAAHAHCPIAVVRGRTPHDAPPDAGPVLVGADGSADSEAALAFACEEARLRGTRLVAVHTWSDILADGMLRAHPLQQDPAEIAVVERVKPAEQVVGWQRKYPDLTIELEVTRGRPVRTLLERGETAQLIVVGCRGRGGFTGMLLGSTSQALIAHSPCPVAVVRPQRTGSGT
ncbi:universal stress protein [Amycolatopsis mediterranei S699]|uniref:Universal stress protein n=4 Tax=Amycolatopsis mediterranei TaxID=33910 RepID=A0A0H3D8E3_AMYMU|nr:universal stress protein [Amycolatopsis mediterranei]ADJ47240.1 universal stress protein [Amycolatopsis mediterranei U32]AEK44064.1 universal stress protein [Amycolatopsis mediterranei S699]AFO78951.1 universal stress protein [Amycolatopsis mediterranei S699]AGT86079.1 universal stress protein [Amycolatopsis mediterranei RB]KDO04798.1 universal stress protein [Amycolatopsis mediterranei]